MKGLFRLGICLSLILAAESFAAAASAQEDTAADVSRSDVSGHVCDVIEASAKRYGVPEAVLVRLLWRESRFNPAARDSSGAVGIAKLTPAVLKRRDVRDPYAISEAVPATASYLHYLEGRFGNLGLAVAAYNLGERRLEQWIAAGGGVMPSNTENYVFEVTGVEAGTFLDPTQTYAPPPLENARSNQEACHALPVSDRPVARGDDDGKSWIAMVAGNWRRSAVIHRWSGVVDRGESTVADISPSVDKWPTPLGDAGIYAATIPVADRSEAEGICGRVRQAGGPCIVRKIQLDRASRYGFVEN